MEPERPSARSSPARGVALIATAVILGVFVLRSGFDTPSSSDDAAASTTETSAPAAPGTTASGGEPTEPAPQPAAPRPPNEVTVVVANTTQVGGAAAGLTQRIGQLEYQTGTPTDAPTPVETSQVLFLEGFQAEAMVLAEQIGVPAANVLPMPAEPPAEIGGAQLLVLLGPDLASG